MNRRVAHACTPELCFMVQPIALGGGELIVGESAGTGRVRNGRVYHGDPIGVMYRQSDRDHRAPVAPLGEETLITEASHEFGPGVGDPAKNPTRSAGLPREPEPGERRQNHVECGFIVRRVDQTVDHIQGFDDRAGPPMSDQQRARIGA